MNKRKRKICVAVPYIVIVAAVIAAVIKGFIWANVWLCKFLLFLCSIDEMLAALILPFMFFLGLIYVAVILFVLMVLIMDTRDCIEVHIDVINRIIGIGLNRQHIRAFRAARKKIPKRPLYSVTAIPESLQPAISVMPVWRFGSKAD